MKFSASLKLNHIFRRLYHTKGVADANLVLYARRNHTPGNRIGYTVGKKLGKAHVRNLVRRRLREIYRLNEARFLPGYDIVVVARTRAIYGRYADLERSFLQLMKKLGILPTK